MIIIKILIINIYMIIIKILIINIYMIMIKILKILNENYFNLILINKKTVY